MSSRQVPYYFTSTSQPTSAVVGDEWFNPATNRLYQYTASNGLAPIWAEQAIGATGIVTVSNLTVNGGTANFIGTQNSLALVVNNMVEPVSLATAPASLLNYEITAQSIIYYTSNSTTNWTLNFRGSTTATLNSVLSIGQSVSVTLMTTNGSTAYYPTSYTIDGVAVTPKWQGGAAPLGGNTSGIDVYSFSIIKTANATFTVFASQTKFV